MIKLSGWDTAATTAKTASVYCVSRAHIVYVVDVNGYSLVHLSDGSKLYVTQSVDTIFAS